MSDTLFEKFIRSNRKEFDQDSPGDSLWDRVAAGIPAEKKTRRFSLRQVLVLSVAASLMFIALTSIYFLVIRKNSHESLPVATVEPAETDGLSREYARQFESAYRSIGERQEQLKIAMVNQPELYKQFQEDLGALDSAYHTLKEQQQKSPNQDLIIRAMIENLRLQAELLSRQLSISNQFKNTKKSNHETSI
jgi:hypothetical protein